MDLFDIPEYEQYKISKEGEVFSTITNKFLKQRINPYGYKTVGVKGTKLIHRLLAITFIPNPNNYPVVNHIDGNKLNNDLSNLEWCTIQQNNAHAGKHKLNKGNSRNREVTRLLKTIREKHK